MGISGHGFTFATNLIDMTENFRMKEVHVGKMIQNEMLRQGRTVKWLAEQIYCEKSNIYKLFKRHSIDLEQLMRISEVLDHNFLRDCFEEYPIGLVNQ